MGRWLPRNFFVLISVATFLFDRLILSADHCNCRKSHPQTMFCEADFVIQVLIRNIRPFVMQRFQTISDQESTLNPHTSQFYAKIKKVYKGSPPLITGRNVKLYMPTRGSCTASLPRTGVYVVSGYIERGKPNISKCTWVQLFSTLQRRQKRCLNRNLYLKSCHQCKIVECYSYKCEKDPKPNTCALNAISGHETCYHLHTYCRYSKHRYGCKWAHSRKLLSNCIRNEEATYMAINHG